uniref:Uncharacterized protein n=1 Tax=Haptolina ericina TaxID=156174 RepID=A0A7S3AYF0_9EUKA
MPHPLAGGEAGGGGDAAAVEATRPLAPPSGDNDAANEQIPPLTVVPAQSDKGSERTVDPPNASQVAAVGDAGVADAETVGTGGSGAVLGLSSNSASEGYSVIGSDEDVSVIGSDDHVTSAPDHAAKMGGTHTVSSVTAPSAAEEDDDDWGDWE